MKYITTFLIVLSSNYLFSQTKEGFSADCIAKWKKGESKLLHIIHKKESNQPGNEGHTIPYEANITVLDSTIEGYTIQWIFNLPPSLLRTNTELAKSLPIYSNMKMIYKTDINGSFTELINWKDVREVYIKMMELSLPKNIDSITQVAIDKAKEMFKTKEAVEAALIKEIMIYHFIYGATFSDKEFVAKTTIPNPFTEDPLPALQKIKVTKWQPGEDYYNVAIKQEIDSIDAAKMIGDIIKKMNLADDKIMEETKNILSNFTIKDHSEYNISQSTGWINKITWQRTAGTLDKIQEESFIMEMEN